MEPFDFESLRPYTDQEIPLVLERMAVNPSFHEVLRFVFPDSIQEVLREIRTITSIKDFQFRIMAKGINLLLEKSASHLTCTGLERLSKEEPSLYISNHRDIALDPAILNILLDEHHFKTTFVTMGDNLLISPLIGDIMKCNKMVTVHRGGAARDLYHNTARLSAYIHYILNIQKDSVWIAQRKGRTKDGNDKTQLSVLKMLFMNSERNFADYASQLNILPFAISYEYEPCDHLKVSEIYRSTYETYRKVPADDLKSIITGLTQFKGRIHLSLGEIIRKEDLIQTDKIPGFKQRLEKLGLLIDNQIYKNYKLWPTNYIAFDLLFGVRQYARQYSDHEKRQFQEYMHHQLAGIRGKEEILQHLFLRVYANPVINKSMVF